MLYVISLLHDMLKFQNNSKTNDNYTSISIMLSKRHAGTVNVQMQQASSQWFSHFSMWSPCTEIHSGAVRSTDQTCL